MEQVAASSSSALPTPAPAALPTPAPAALPTPAPAALPTPAPAALPTPPPADPADLGSSSALPTPAPADLGRPDSNVVELALGRLDSNVVELERLGSSLQLEMLENDKLAHEILNGLANHIGFILLYSMGGLILQVSDKVDCWSAFLIMLVVTLVFIVGIVLAIHMTKLKLERLRGAVKQLNKRKSALTEQAKDIEKRITEWQDTWSSACGRQENATPMERSQSLSGRVEALQDSRDMSSFSDINEKMMTYILACGIVYLILVAIFFLIHNCGGWSCPASYITEACTMVLIFTGVYFLNRDTWWTRGCFMLVGVLLFLAVGGFIVTHCSGGGDGARLKWK